MTILKPRKSHSPSVRDEYVEQYKESGLSVRQFCQEHGLVRQTFYSWLNLQKVKSNTSTGRAEKNFLPMNVTDIVSGDIYAEVNFPDGKVVRFFQEVDACQIIHLLKVS